ncbi:DUF6790 family protein [Rhodopseudomonas palustris]|uniref:DUF6790 family protein n=1 Tax=Rhodopseudomonas palustris TaxID=1076 RepID=UPI001F1FBBC7|nr:DUF6790 family protein [Rhodopseudomonas palustris]
MAEVIKATIVFVLSNFSLSFLVIGLLFALVAIARAPKPLRSHDVIEKLLAWHVFWSIGVCSLYNFVMHGFFGKISAAFIGWADSPFQFEVATASLGFSVVGFLAAFRSFDLRLAAIVGPGLFMLGAAAGHIHQMLTQHNFAPGNAGVVFYTDILIPVFGGVLLWLQHRGRGAVAPFADGVLAMPQDDGEFSRDNVRMRNVEL